ncbi:Fatty acid amide hydrolase [Heracleum sosnowskyi]|uniref:Fatty acid amide hydrolase n=1 Tax=Heracleum sosnowskyi TaxID=360622 RepID=A0AAD8IWS9_9APIA|nr:Fatty acid amide hydrolase [Heracleum sosnowskyi]
MGISKRVVYKPADQVDISSTSDEVYVRANVKAPRMTGFLVKLFVWFLELRILSPLLLYILKRENQIHKLVSFVEIEDPPLYVPLHPYEEHKEPETKHLEAGLSPSEQVQQAIECINSLESVRENENNHFRHWTILDYSRAYLSRETTPNKVADQFIASIRKSCNPASRMSFFISCDFEDILRQANESTLRYERGEPLSTLDGVPIAVKDEIDCLPYPTTGGTKWLHKVRPCTDDADCVKRLKLCGAILVGKTNMHELGAGTSGINPHYGATRNPYDVNKITGGSSSGSAAVVSAGLCPAALGVDGGGSVRIPAALCGVVGFKPTFGRVSHAGVLPLNYTVGMVGVLAGTVEDAMIVYSAISAQLPSDQPITEMHPKVHLPLLNLPLPSCMPKVKLAKYDEWFSDCTYDIKLCCSNALIQLQKIYGWETVEVTLPEIEAMRLAHYLTMGSECATALACHLELNMKEVGWDARVALSVYGAFDSKEYLTAQRIRNRQLQIHQKIFDQADVIVTPTTGVTAYTIQDDALKTGELDYINAAALVRYMIAGNFLGLPAVTVPVGYDEGGLPIGLQFIGKPWCEASLIYIAYAVQALCAAGYRKPRVFYDQLSDLKRSENA